MAAEFSSYEVEPGDTKNDILNTLAEGKPWLFLVAESEGDGIGIKAETGGGIRDVSTVRKMLTLTLDAIPEEA